MQKDYKLWNARKVVVNQKELRVYFHEREVWWSVLGLNIGFEQDGKGKEFLRPIVIVKKFNNETFLSVPLTSKKKIGKHYFPLNQRSVLVSIANLSQLRLLDGKRLKYKIGLINESEFVQLKKRIIELIK